MRLIAILLSLWLNRYTDRVDAWRNPEPFFRYAARVYARVRPYRPGNGVLPLLVLLGPPLLLAAFLQWLFSGWLLGLVNLLFGVWALLFAHGPGSVDGQLRVFAQAWREGRGDDAQAALAQLLGADAAVADGAPVSLAQVIEGFFWQSFRRGFAPLFWFVLLGPVGAILVRLVELARQFALQQEGAESVEQSTAALSFALDWLPARATALAMGLAGSFVHALEGWKDSRQDPDEGARGLVVKAATGALNEPTYVAEPDAVDELLVDARGLISRTLLVWLAVIALLSLAGLTP